MAENKDCDCLTQDSQIDSIIEDEVQLEASLENVVEISKAYNGGETKDAVVNVDNDKNVITTTLQKMWFSSFQEFPEVGSDNLIYADKGTGVLYTYNSETNSYEELISEPQITIDTEMSDTSENAVQNKVIKSYVDTEVNTINGDIDSLGNTVTDVENKINGINTSITTINGNISTIEGEIGQINTEITGIKGDLNGVALKSDLDNYIPTQSENETHYSQANNQNGQFSVHISKNGETTDINNLIINKDGVFITGKVKLQGDADISGVVTVKETETLKVKDNIVVTNADGVDLVDMSGLGIRKNSSDTYGIVYDPASDSVKLGLGKLDNSGKFTFNEGEGQPVAVRDDSSLFVDGHLVKWDATNHKFVDAGDIDKYITTKVDKSATGFSYSDTWSPKTWNGLEKPSALNIWTDGENIYYSDGSKQYVLDKETSTWKVKTWSGYTPEYARIWTDGKNIYYSQYENQYVLDKATSTWSPKTWNGFSDFSKGAVWTDESEIYLSQGTDQYVLDKETSTWNAKTWNGLTKFWGSSIWTDGNEIYCSSGTKQYVLNQSNSTWETKTWNGLTEFNATYIWTDGTNIYYSDVSKQYVLDKSTSTWNPKTWNGVSVVGDYIWSDGEDIYISDSYSRQHVLDKSLSASTIDNSGKSISLLVSDGSTTLEFKVSQDKVTVNGKEVATVDALANKQDTLTAGSNITITDNTISAKDTTYTAGENITISADNVISAAGGTSIDIVQETGTSTTAVMSQKATTDELNKKANLSNIPTQLSQLSEDETHRVVTDTEKDTWNGKQDKLTNSEFKQLDLDTPVDIWQATKADGGVGLISQDSDTSLSVMNGLISAVTGNGETGFTADKASGSSFLLGGGSSLAIAKNSIKFDDKNVLTENSIVQSTGTATDKVMSQKTITDELDKKTNKPVDETFNITQEAWVALNGNAPYTFMTSVTATKTIGENTEVGIINDQPTLFANYGFVVGLLDGQTIGIFSIGQPTASVNLTVRFKE